MRRSGRFWLGIAVSLAALYLAFRDADSGSLVAALRQANYLWLAPALGAYFVGVGVRALRWHYLLRPIKVIPNRRLFPLVVIGYMANDVLPARMGELVRAYMLSRKEGLSATAGLATIIVERLFDGLTMLAFIGVAALFGPLGLRFQHAARLVGAIFFAALLGLVLIASRPGLARRLGLGLIGPLPPAPRGRLEGMLAGFLMGLKVLQSGRCLAAVLLLSLVAWLWEAAMYYLIGLGFGLGLPFHAMLLTLAVANLGTLVPSSPGYVGTFDALAIFTLVFFGVARELATSYTIVLHTALLLPVVLLGFYYLWRESLSLGQLSVKRPEGGWAPEGRQGSSS